MKLLDSWLSIHEFDARLVWQIVDCLPGYSPANRLSAAEGFESISVDQALDICHSALIEALPLCADTITEITNEAPRCLLAKEVKHK